MLLAGPIALDHIKHFPASSALLHVCMAAYLGLRVCMAAPLATSHPPPVALQEVSPTVSPGIWRQFEPAAISLPHQQWL